jgi:hypothetical protein
MLESRLTTRLAMIATAGVLLIALEGCTGLTDAPRGPSTSCEDDDCATGGDPVGPGDPGGTGGGNPGNGPPGVGDPGSPNGVGWSTRFTKLSNEQWENTVTDLLVLAQPTGFSKDFTQERLDDEYTTLAAAKGTIGGDAWGRYQTAAEQVAVLVTSDDAKLAKLLPSGAPSDATERGRLLIERLGRRAYRRPLSDAEQTTLLTLFKQGPALVGGDAFKSGAQLVIEALLQSPYFLYRVETATAPSGENKAYLSGDEVAARLAYSLWNTLPSDELFAAADAGELDNAAGVASWAKEMLADSRAAKMLASFHEQTFLIAAYGSQDKDESLGFDAAALTPVLQQEARLFFEDVVINGNRGISALLTEPVAYVNATTAPYYNLTGVTGDALQKKALDPQTRAGLLTQLGFLTKNATRTTSDPVHRGLLVLRKLLCDEPDPPPMMFELPKPEPGLTTREVYTKATACGVGCHDTLINPPGFAFEGFDTLGRVRTMEANKPIDATGSLSVRDGYTPEEKRVNPVTTLEFDGAVDMVNKLADQPRVHECYARNWLTYVLAREVDPVERGASKLLRDRSLDDGSARDLLISLVQLDTFRARVSE